jgi:two-component SAPR family response regulator
MDENLEDAAHKTFEQQQEREAVQMLRQKWKLSPLQQQICEELRGFLAVRMPNVMEVKRLQLYRMDDSLQREFAIYLIAKGVLKFRF